jgi:hypothetical protein
MTEIKTLVMIKMEKNLIAVIEKGHSRQPYRIYDLVFWVKTFIEENKKP